MVTITILSSYQLDCSGVSCPIANSHCDEFSLACVCDTGFSANGGGECEEDISSAGKSVVFAMFIFILLI